MVGQNTIVDHEFKLNKKQLDFCINYVESGNGRDAAIKAGYAPKNAEVTASRMLIKSNIKDKIQSLLTSKNAHKIATGQEVMEFFTRMMNGEEKDQFGIEVSASDRIKAAQEIAKRTVDIENRAKGLADNKLEISLKWD